MLEVKASTGNSKVYQMIDFERYFSWNKDGYKFIITEVFEETKTKIDNRGKHNQLPFIEEMELLLIDMMIKDKDLVISDSRLMLELCMINPNYHKYFMDNEKLSELLNMDLEYIVDFYDTTNGTFKGAIETVIKKLEIKKLMLHQSVYMVNHISMPDIDNVSELFDYDECTGLLKGKAIKPIITHRQATKEESEAILGIERRTLVDEFNCDNVGQVIRKGMGNQYYTRVNKLILDHLSIVKFYQANKFIYNIHELARQKYKVLNQHKVKEIQDLLNLKVMIRIDKNATNRYEKAIGLLKEYDDKIHRIDDDYIDNINTLSNNLIDIHNIDGI
ncbi:MULTISPECIES: hypothetical protein [Lysinibacillus]|uniref:hypothetical protein n=1 Tax=Lysinibacillus TaxID=400634 RepID=UPI00214C832B|nr:MULTISPECIES: hypothetical protein [Lysinibacillus]UUV25878.1 hypothetical protein NP781_04480 [Lysinibacillus sp. FN11]UYB48751.1 hypothetical protein OCI51_07270 [Lysinibacillus capsici]